jgi:hypothetical protein
VIIAYLQRPEDPFQTQAQYADITEGDVMPEKRLIAKLFQLLDSSHKKLKREHISDLLKNMKKQERAAKSELAKEKNRSKRKRLSTKVKILHTQRKKALKRYKELKKKP